MKHESTECLSIILLLMMILLLLLLPLKMVMTAILTLTCPGWWLPHSRNRPSSKTYTNFRQILSSKSTESHWPWSRWICRRNVNFQPLRLCSKEDDPIRRRQTCPIKVSFPEDDVTLESTITSESSKSNNNNNNRESSILPTSLDKVDFNIDVATLSSEETYLR